MATRAGQIIAGYDGSPDSSEALDWAAREARLRGLPLTICHAWASGYTAAGAGAADTALPVAEAGEADPARERAAAALARGVLRAQTSDSAVTPRPLLVCGPAARVLCEQCAGADMLVVGNLLETKNFRSKLFPITEALFKQT